MTPMEQMVWAAAFSEMYLAERRFIQENPQAKHLSVDRISGFSCAEVADEALEKYREAIHHPDKLYLIPVLEDAT